MVADLLAQLGRPGAFATGERVPRGDLALEIEGVGSIDFPVSKAKAQALCRVARRARHGLKDRTLLDVNVRDTWEIRKSRVRIDQRRWKKTLAPALVRIRDALGLAPGAVLEAKLHNLLVYGPGQFFVPHQDSEKGDGMIGTLVVTLPSNFDGGAIVVQHHDEKVVFRGTPKDLVLIAFYADCHHEVRPVKAGHRIVLTYDLFVSGGGAPAFAVAAPRLDALEARVRDFLCTPASPRWAGDGPREAPDRLVYLLDHQYTQRGLHWTRLKNADAARAAALREVASRLDCDIALALADVHESWSCEDEYDGYRGRRPWHRSRYRETDDDSFSETADDEGVAAPALIEMMDSSVELRHFVDASGRGSAVSSRVDAAEVCFTKPSEKLDPFRSEHEGYMGNWGNTVDRWYHRAAIVLWPRSRTFVIRARASGRWAIDEIRRALARGKIEEARRMAADLAPFWPRVVGDDRSKLVSTTLRVARDLDVPELAAALLRPFRIEHVGAKTAPLLVGVVARYGLTWFQEACSSFIVSEPEHGQHPYVGLQEDRRRAWLCSLPAFVRAASEDGQAEAILLSVSIATEQWRWVVSAYRAALRARPSAVLESLARLDRPILALVESSIILGVRELRGEIETFLTSRACPAPALVRLLRTALETYEPKDLRGLGLEAVRAHAVSLLTEDLRAPPRSPDDWSISASSTCRCALCIELRRFLASRSKTRYEWPLAKDGRAHVHQLIDAQELPVTHQTRRSGRPYTLVLEKTRALFDKEAASRAAQEEGLGWLSRQTAFAEPKRRR